MAITKIMHMKEGKGHNKAKHLKNAIQYILNPTKTEGGWLVGGNCGTDPDTAYQCMMDTKERFGKKWGRQGYHMVLSFPKGEVDPGLALNIMQEFAQEYLGDRFDMVYSVHTDTEHIHGHLIFNSIDRLEGKKYRYEKGDWEKYIQPVTNRICQEHGLSYISFKHPEQAKSLGWDWKIKRDELRSMIDAAIQKAESLEEVKDILKEQGCRVRDGMSDKYGAYFATRMPGAGKAIRNYTLGPGYSLNAIRKKIKLKGMRVPPLVRPAPKVVGFQYRRFQKGGLSVYQIYFWKRAFLAKKLYSVRDATGWEQEKIRKELRNLQDQFGFLYKHGIREEKGLEALRMDLGKQEREYLAQIFEIGSLFDARRRKRKGISDFDALREYQDLKKAFNKTRLPEKRNFIREQMEDLEQNYDLDGILQDYNKYQRFKGQIWKKRKENKAEMRMAEKIRESWSDPQEKEESRSWKREKTEQRNI